MKHQSADKEENTTSFPDELGEKGDALWDLLGKASERQPDDFFARNIMRKVRLEESETRSLSRRFLSIFTSRRLAIGAVACACVFAGYQMFPTEMPPSQTDLKPTFTEENSQSLELAEKTENDFSEIVIEETLLAAADDPELFTSDEIVAMIGL